MAQENPFGPRQGAIMDLKMCALRFVQQQQQQQQQRENFYICVLRKGFVSHPHERTKQRLQATNNARPVRVPGATIVSA